MLEPIITAGLDSLAPQPTNPRRELIRSISKVLRKADATEAEHEDALEALVELSKE
jgi:hypothetical protein